MTTDTQLAPTDTEIDAVAQEYLLRMFGSRVVFNGVMIDFARAVLAKWGTPQLAPATQQPEGDVVAYLDVGVGGYLDLGSDLSEDALQQLPKGRHALVIAGTYGIDGYVAAPQPSPTAQADSVQEDAARYRWLREGNDAKHGAAWHVAVNLYGFEWDAAIDAAISANGGSK